MYLGILYLFLHSIALFLELLNSSFISLASKFQVAGCKITFLYFIRGKRLKFKFEPKNALSTILLSYSRSQSRLKPGIVDKS